MSGDGANIAFLVDQIKEAKKIVDALKAPSPQIIQHIAPTPQPLLEEEVKQEQRSQ